MTLDLNIARMNSSTPAMRDVQFLQLEIQQIMKGGLCIFCIFNIFLCYNVININLFMFTWTVRHLLVLTFEFLSFPSRIQFLGFTKLLNPEQILCFISNRLQVFFKIDVLKNSVISTGKHPCWSLFLIKFTFFLFLKRDSNMGFPVKITRFLRTLFL